MDSNQAHIDQIIKEKLNQFEPTPPVHVWSGIEQALIDEKKPFFIFLYAKQFIAAAVLALLALALWYFIPVNDNKPLTETDIIDKTEEVKTVEIVETEEIIAEEKGLYKRDKQEDTEAGIGNNADKTIPPDEITSETSTIEIKPTVASSEITTKTPREINPGETPGLKNERLLQIIHLDNKKVFSLQILDNTVSDNETLSENTVNFKNRKDVVAGLPSAREGESKAFKNYWNIGLYFTPEMMVNNIDSVTLMNTYALNIEPSWYFSKHWFMRFGAGISYVRDRGFANVDFISTDYMGSYDSVVNVTFEEIDNEIIPVYHTKEVEIWDSIRHLSITEVTNKYFYLQFPLMFGYHNSTDKFKWYFYGGPAINISISEQIEDPKASIEYVEIIDLENRLPHRLNYSLQLWVGAGIDFRIGQKFSLAFEPNYRYYFDPNYKENNYKTALSGLGLRLGLVYKLDRK